MASDPATVVSAEADSQAARKGAPALVAQEKVRLAEAEAKAAASAETKLDAQRASAAAAARLREKRLLEELVTDEAAVAALSQAKLEAQLRCWEESYLFGTDDSGWDPIIKATLSAQEETKLEALIPFKKKLVFGQQQGGPRKPDLPGEAAGTQKELHRRWMAKKQAQLRAVIIFHRWREAGRAATAGAGSAAAHANAPGRRRSSSC